MDKWMDTRMDKWTDGQMDRQTTSGRMDAQKDGQMDRRTVFAKCVMDPYLSSWRKHSLGVAWLVFLSSAATLDHSVRGSHQLCDRSACDHKHHWQGTQGLIFPVGRWHTGLLDANKDAFVLSSWKQE